jgi:hypothetical protein
MVRLTAVAWVLALGAAQLIPGAREASARARPRGSDARLSRTRSAGLAADSLHSRRTGSWPPGTEVVPFQDLEGLIVFDAHFHGSSGADTSGPIVLDSGAGYLAIDMELARLLGVADSYTPSSPITLASRPLPRLEIGNWVLDQVEPVLTVDASVPRRVTDVPVLGLFGAEPMKSGAVMVDYRDHRLGFLSLPPDPPPTPDTTTPAGSSRRSEAGSAIDRSRAALSARISPEARPLRFELEGDGKIVVHARLDDPAPPRESDTLTLIVDTGATKCVMFGRALEQRTRSSATWPALRGLTAPTLLGATGAKLVRLPRLRLVDDGTKIERAGVDAVVIDNELAPALTRAVGERIDGLLGYSFLRHYGLSIDYRHRVLWLDPQGGTQDARPWEYCQPGIQLERDGSEVRVVGVVEHSPAAKAGIVPGDEVTSIGPLAVSTTSVLVLSRALEGPPGSRVRVGIRTGAGERAYTLTRRWLL